MDFALPDECSDDGVADRLAAFVREAGFDPAQIVAIYLFGDTPELVDRLA